MSIATRPGSTGLNDQPREPNAVSHVADAEIIHDPADAPPGKAVARPAPARPPVIPGAGSIVELLHAAVKQGTPVAELKELVQLHEHMEKRQALKAYFDALAAFQAEAPLINQSHTAKIATRGGGSYSYTYAPLDEIARTILPLLTKHGLSYRWDTVVEKNAITVRCTVSHVAGHSETSSMTLPIDNTSAMSEQQKVGAAMTFGQRRSLTAALGLVTTDEDPDAAKDLDPTTVNDDQYSAIQDLIDEKALVGDRLKRFLVYMGVEQIGHIRAADYEKAMTALQQVKAK